MFHKFKIRAALAVGVALAAASVGLITPALSSASSTPNVITIAEPANGTPNYIFPFYPPAMCTVANTSQFQELMYRPLYFYGVGGSAAQAPSVSLGNAPVYSNGDKTVTITTKGWKFADGQTINAESVMFFLNMYDAVPSGFCTYTKGLGIPDQIASASGSGDTVVIRLKSAVSPVVHRRRTGRCLADGQLRDMTSAIEERCASGEYSAGSTISACKEVQAYLNKIGANTSTFADKFWQSGTDGHGLIKSTIWAMRSSGELPMLRPPKGAS